MKLNNKQQLFVDSSFHLAVIAGPGTGKTHALSVKIQKEALRQKRILALTFTKKAAHELQTRALKTSTRRVHINTFHGFCHFLLSKDSKIKLIDEYKRHLIISQIAKKQGLSFSEAMPLISLKKGMGEVGEIGERLYDEYEARLNKEGLWDFDDLIINALKLDKFPLYDYVFVDEFQDTNPAQYALLQKISVGAIVQVIGDPKQAIYTFRGSQPEIFAQYEKDFQCKCLVFENTYRSAKSILTASQALYPNSPRLKTDNLDQGQAFLIDTANEFTEADFVVNDIKKLLGGADLLEASGYYEEDGAELSDFAILTRTHFSARSIKRALDKNNIPFQSVSGDSIYLKKRIAFIIEVLRYLNDKAENISSKAKAIVENHKLMPNVSLVKTIELITKKAGFSSEDNDAGEFINIVRHYDAMPQPLKAFIENLDELIENNYYDPRANAVSVISMHAAKGLEFENVYVLGLENGNIPSKKAVSKKELEEEKRLFYVAITRAKQRLVITRANKRNNKQTTKSDFLEPLKNSLAVKVDSQGLKKLEKIRLKKLKKSQIKLFD